MKFRKLSVLIAAIAMLLLCSCSSSHNGDNSAYEGTELYTEKKYSEALICFLDAETNGVKKFDEGKLYFSIANCCYRTGDYEKSIEYHNKCLVAERTRADSPTNAELLSDIGNCWYQLGDYEKCIEYQLECLDNDPEYFKGWYNLGAAYRKMGDKDNAMKSFEKALEYDPKNTESVSLYVSLGSIYIELGKPISSITYLEKSLEHYPDNDDAYAYLAIAYKMAFEPAKSAESLEKAKALGYPKIDAIQEQLNKLN